MLAPTPWECQSQGLTLRGARWGNADGIKVLFIHGFLDNIHSVWPLAAHLPGYQWAAIDLPGHGWSDHRHLDAGYHFIDWLRVIADVLAGLQWSHCALIGHSLGAAIAACYAGTFSEQISRVVLLDSMGPASRSMSLAVTQLRRHLHTCQKPNTPTFYATQLQAVTFWQRLVRGLSYNNAALLVARNLIASAQGLQWRYDPRLRWPVSSYWHEEQVQAFLQAIRAPVLFVRAEAGLPLADELVQQRLQAIEQGLMQTIAGCHHVHMENPQAIAKMIAPFLADC